MKPKTLKNTINNKMKQIIMVYCLIFVLTFPFPMLNNKPLLFNGSLLPTFTRFQAKQYFLIVRKVFHGRLEMNHLASMTTILIYISQECTRAHTHTHKMIHTFTSYTYIDAKRRTQNEAYTNAH